MSMEERLLAKASELIDQRVAQIMDAPSGPRVKRSGEYITVQPQQGLLGTGTTYEWKYAGQLQVMNDRVFIVPFVTVSYYQSFEDGVFIEPQLQGRSLFSTNRPSLPRRPNGGAVFLEKTWSISKDGEGENWGFKAAYVSNQIIQQDLDTPYPRSPGEVNWPADATDISEVSVTKSESKCYTLIGVYTKEGKVIPGYFPSPLKVVSFTDPQTQAGEYGEGIFDSVTTAPVTRIATPINP